MAGLDRDLAARNAEASQLQVGFSVIGLFPGRASLDNPPG